MYSSIPEVTYCLQKNAPAVLAIIASPRGAASTPSRTASQHVKREQPSTQSPEKNHSPATTEDLALTHIYRRSLSTFMQNNNNIS